MSELLEIQTTHREVSDLVEALARSVGDESIRLTGDHEVNKGEWVRFTVCLKDGTSVLEGVGRCDGSLPRGNPIDRYEVHLSSLQFDERNEIMFDRMLLAKDAVEGGPETGTIDLDGVLGDDAVIEEAPKSRAKSIPPPAPATARRMKDASRPAWGEKAAPAEASVPKAQPRATNPESRIESALRSMPKKSTVQKAVPKRTKPKSEPPKRTKPKSDRPRKPISPSPRLTKPVSEHPTRRESSAPRKIPSSPVPSIGTEVGSLQITVAPELVELARKVAQALPKQLLPRDSKTRPEEAALKAALRVGLSALAALKPE